MAQSRNDALPGFGVHRPLGYSVQKKSPENRVIQNEGREEHRDETPDAPARH